MGLNHDFNAAGNNFPGRQQVTHAFMPIGNAVTGRDYAELQRCSTGLENTLGHIFSDSAQVAVAGNNAVPRVGDSNQWS